MREGRNNNNSPSALCLFSESFSGQQPLSALSGLKEPAAFVHSVTNYEPISVVLGEPRIYIFRCFRWIVKAPVSHFNDAETWLGVDRRKPLIHRKPVIAALFGCCPQPTTLGTNGSWRLGSSNFVVLQFACECIQILAWTLRITFLLVCFLYVWFLLF